ncbi:hypothetical protein [Vitreoscilla filiformis]|nr:hypothetical protein [Vitreoscilla filiformis]
MQADRFLKAVVVACAAALSVAGVGATEAPLSEAEARPVLVFPADVAVARFSVALPNFDAVSAVRLVSVPERLRGCVGVASVVFGAKTHRAKIAVRLKDRGMFLSEGDEPIVGAVKFQFVDPAGVKKNYFAKLEVQPAAQTLPTSMKLPGNQYGVVFLSVQHGPNVQFFVGSGFDPRGDYFIKEGSAPTVVSKNDFSLISDGSGWSVKVDVNGNMYLKPRADAIVGGGVRGTMIITSEQMNGQMQLQYDIRPAF